MKARPIPAAPRVVANLMQLDPIWRKHKVAPAAVYEALRDVVMPPERPTELFLYTTSLATGGLRSPQSVGKLLAAWAVRAGKSGELKQAIAARQGHVMAALPCLILAAQLAMAADDAGASIEALEAIAARMKKDTSRTTSELACHAAIPALEHRSPELAKAAVGVLDSCTKGLETSGGPEPVASLLLMLARRQFGLGNEAGGRKQLEAYLESAERTSARYGGDYVLYIRKQQLERVAAEYARAGLWADAMASLGRFLDTPSYSGGDPPVDSTLSRTLARIESSPVKERYQTLHAWTMPEKDRQAVRILTSPVGRVIVPSIFWRAAAGCAGSNRPDGREAGGACVGARARCEHGTGADRGRAGCRHAGTACARGSRRRALEGRQEDRECPRASSSGRAARGQGQGVIKEIDDRAAEIARGTIGLRPLSLRSASATWRRRSGWPRRPRPGLSRSSLRKPTFSSHAPCFPIRMRP